MQHFALSIIITLTALAISFFWAGVDGVITCALLISMEIGFSFDNAVVNATVLKHMESVWQKRFLTWGMVVSVFGMYYLFPIIIVAVATGLDILDVAKLAFEDQEAYSRHVIAAHTSIASFGGMFLLMVFFKFIMNAGKKLHWLGRAEQKLASLGKLESVEIILALALLLMLQHFLPAEEAATVLTSGVFGVMLYVTVHSLVGLFASEDAANKAAAYTGIGGFIYLNILDASFSLDAVVGSFAISHDIVIIMLGLSAGAMFVRSLTVYLVKKNLLDQYVYLEHGAHYGIGSLAIIMLVSIIHPVSEIVTGVVGITFIALSFASSVRYRRKQR